VASHECTAACWLIVPPTFEHSNFSLLDSPAPTEAFRTPAAEVGTTMSGNRPINFAEMPTSTLHRGIFYMPQICDMGSTALLPFRRKACLRVFSAIKNPTASAGFEPANLGTRGQHANPRPPKPLKKQSTEIIERKKMCESVI
jgi:hypothetical protein